MSELLAQSEQTTSLLRWSKACPTGQPVDGGRIHIKIHGRYVTIFRNKGKLSCIDSICHHAGGPLTLGVLQDIEDLNATVVLCPWHKFMVSIEDGRKAYQGVAFVGGKPINAGWRMGKTVQRSHNVVENDMGVFVALDTSQEPCSSDNDACSSLCAQSYEISSIIDSEMSPEAACAAGLPT